MEYQDSPMTSVGAQYDQSIPGQAGNPMMLPSPVGTNSVHHPGFVLQFPGRNANFNCYTPPSPSYSTIVGANAIMRPDFAPHVFNDRMLYMQQQTSNMMNGSGSGLRPFNSPDAMHPTATLSDSFQAVRHTEQECGHTDHVSYGSHQAGNYTPAEAQFAIETSSNDFQLAHGILNQQQSSGNTRSKHYILPIEGPVGPLNIYFGEPDSVTQNCECTFGCGRKFEAYIALEEHERAIHEQESQYGFLVCQLFQNETMCRETFTNLALFPDHLLTHHGIHIEAWTVDVRTCTVDSVLAQQYWCPWCERAWPLCFPGDTEGWWFERHEHYRMHWRQLQDVPQPLPRFSNQPSPSVPSDPGCNAHRGSYTIRNAQQIPPSNDFAWPTSQ